MTSRRRATSLIALLIAGMARAADGYVAVSFEFPDRPRVNVTLTSREVTELTGDKLPYKIEYWVRGALAKAHLESEEHKDGGKLSLTSIGGLANGSAGRWVYFVNGIRSPYHVNTQIGIDARTIRYVFEKSTGLAGPADPPRPR